MFGKTMRRNVVALRGAERLRRLLQLRVELLQHRLHGADDERQRHEHERENDRRLVKATLMPTGEVGP